MADDTDTRDGTPATPAPPRRRAPRATKPKAAAGKSSPTKSAAAKAPTKRAAPAAKPEGEAKPTAKRPPAKPRAAKRQTPAPKRNAKKPENKGTGKWGVAAIAGGVAAVGAAAAALLTLRGSTPKPTPPAKPKGAHTADGTDASKSLAAGIADEGTIPEA